MRRIIDGKRYDTETSTEVYDWTNGLPCGDFSAVTLTLYRTTRDAWFMVKENGASATLIAKTPASAFAFLQENSNDRTAFEAAENFFPENITDA